MELPHESRRRGRPRDPEVELRVLAASLEEYADKGWAALTMDGVARRAGVGKSTMYLRWRNREALLADAVAALSDGTHPVDTGSLRRDTEVLARALQQMYDTSTGWAMARILIDVAGTGERAGAFAAIVERHRDATCEIIRRAVARGELRDGAPPQLYVNALYGAFIVFRMMRPWDQASGVTPDPEELLGQVVEFVLAGLTPWLVERDPAPGRSAVEQPAEP